MKKYSIIPASILLLFLCNASHADLTNPTYISAKKLYAENNFKEAKEYLEKYKIEDAEFLSAHPLALKKINTTIIYCTSQLNNSNDGFTPTKEEPVIAVQYPKTKITTKVIGSAKTSNTDINSRQSIQKNEMQKNNTPATNGR